MTKEPIEIQIPNFDGKTAGEMLRAARTTGRKKRELQTIARNLCIREEFLEALEAGEYHKIPELVYILGFARNYALELELDPEIVVKKIKYELGILKDEEEEEKQDAPQVPQIEVPTDYSKSRGGAAALLGDMSEFLARSWKLIVVLLLMGTVAAALVFGMRGRDSDKRAQDAPVVEQAADAVAPTFRLPIRESFGTANRANATVVLQATAETWLKVEDSRGETLFSRVLTAGDVYYAPITGNPRATVGNAGGIDVWVGGVQAPRLGADHVRKSGVMLNPGALMPAPATAAE